MGVVALAFLAAGTAPAPPATITSTFNPTSSSASSDHPGTNVGIDLRRYDTGTTEQSLRRGRSVHRTEVVALLENYKPPEVELDFDARRR